MRRAPSFERVAALYRFVVPIRVWSAVEDEHVFRHGTARSAAIKVDSMRTALWYRGRSTEGPR